MRVAQVSFSSSGGAGRVATLLNKGLNSLGVQSEHFFRTESNLRAAHDQVSQRIVAVFDNGLASPRSFENQVSLFRSRTGSLKTEDLKGFDVVHLHWTPGLVSLSEILEISERFRTVITLHDYFFFSGGCHFSGGCEGFQSDCLSCPAVYKPFQKEISKQLELKKSLAAKPNVTFTTPSCYLRDLASVSSALCHAEVLVVANPVNVLDSLPLRTQRPSNSAPRILFVAENLNDRRKGLDQALAVFLEIKNQQPDAELHIAGDGQVRNPHAIQHGKLGKHQLGKLISEMDWLLATSQEDVAPNIVVESAALGLPSLVRLQDWNKRIYSSETGQLVFNQLPPKDFNENALEFSERAIVWSKNFSMKQVSESFIRLYGGPPKEMT